MERLGQQIDWIRFLLRRRSSAPSPGKARGRTLAARVRLRAWIPLPAMDAFRAFQGAGFLALGWGASLSVLPVAGADQRADAAAEEYGRVVMMQRYIVSATRIDKNPWRYASLPGFEILSRASDDATAWWIDATRRGWWFQNEVMPKDWLPASPVPYTLIIDDTNLETVPIGELHAQPINFQAPADASVLVDGHDVVPDVHEVLDRMSAFAERVRVLRVRRLPLTPAGL